MSLIQPAWLENSGTKMYVPGDVFNLKERLNEYDPRLDLKYNETEDFWAVTYESKSTGIREVKRIYNINDLTPELYEQIVAGDSHKGGQTRDFAKEFELKKELEKKEYNRKWEEKTDEFMKRLIDAKVYDTGMVALTRSAKQRKLPGKK